MTSHDTATTTDTPRTGSHRPVAAVYVVLAILGLVGTWYYNLVFIGGGSGDYLGAWFANPASSSAAVDVIVAAVAACLFYVREGLRLHWNRAGIAALVVLTFVVALAVTFPLFLALRELDLARSKR